MLISSGKKLSITIDKSIKIIISINGGEKIFNFQNLNFEYLDVFKSNLILLNILQIIL